jgi:hypothetical protein
MEKIEVSKRHLKNLCDDLDKATALIDLVRQQLEAKHESGGGMIQGGTDITTDFQLATMLELVDGLLLEQRGSVNEILGVTA